VIDNRDTTRVAAEFVDEVRSITPFGRGLINETFLVTAAVGDCVLQRLNTDVFSDPDAVMRNVVVVHTHLLGELVPEPLRTRDGDWLVHDVSGTWRAWRRVPNAQPVGEPSAATARAAGALLGRFHAALVDLDPSSVTETLPGFHDPRRRVDALRAAVASDPCTRAESARDEIELVLRAEPLVARAGDLVARVPRRVAHNDAKLDNFLFRAAEAVCLVDLDTLMPGAWFWDVGDLLRSASTRSREDDARAAIDPQLYRATLDAYRRAGARVLTPAELDDVESAGAIVTFEQAVRFLTDWIEGDVYYRTTRPDQNLDRTRAQLRLLESMPGTVPYS